MKRILKLVTLFAILLTILSIAGIKSYAATGSNAGSSSSSNLSIVATKSTTKVAETLIIKLGDTDILKANLPSGETITWTSSNENVLKIDQNGMVITKGAGKVTVTATSASKTVSKEILVWNIKLTNGQYWTYGSATSDSHKEILYKTAYVAGELTSNGKRFKILALESSNKDNKSVKPGQYITYAKTSNYTYSLKPAADVSAPGKVTKLEVNPATASIAVGNGNSTTLKAVVSPSDVSQAVVWKITSDTTKATVSTSGKVALTSKAVAGDKITVTATSQVDSNFSAICTIEVTAKPIEVTKVVINASTTTAHQSGSEFGLSAKVSPDNATNKEIEWSSNNDKVTVSQTGLVKISSDAKAGTVVSITAKSVSNQKEKDKYTFTVVEATSAIKLNKTEIIVEKGKTKNLTATIDKSGDKIKWTSDNDKVATVSSKGVVKGISKGECTITATSNLDSSKKATCKVIVGNPITSIAFTKTSYTFELNDEKTFDVMKTKTLKIKPENPVNTELKYSVDKEGILKIDESANKIVAIGKGKVKLTVTNPITGKKASCTVTVTAPAVAVQSIAFDNPPTELPIGGSATLKVLFTPTGATNTKVTYKTGDKNIATVSDKGKVTINSKAKAGKTVTIKAISADGKKEATCTITVTPKNATGMTLTKSATLVRGKSAQLKVTITPSGANKEVEWSTSNESIVAVDQSGKVTAVGVGKATITATSKANTSLKKECIITVTEKKTVESITLNKTKLELDPGKSETLTVDTPEAYAEGSLKWKSSNTSIATVNQSGKVTIKSGAKEGKTATITVEGKNAAGKKVSAKCTVTVGWTMGF